MILSPSILSADFTKLGDQIEKLVENDVKWLHFDIMDGMFVPNITFGPPVLKSLNSHYDNLYMDAHMMVHKPERYIKAIREAGADGINIHIEATEDAAATLKAIRELGANPGISISPETPVEAITDVLELVDLVLVMTVHPGFGGQSYMEECTDKIKEIYKIKKEKGYGFVIQADGGIHSGNLKHVLEAGAESIVAGSGIFKGDIDANIKAFNKIAEESYDRH